ncbi:hypothetical protein C8R43DRAFT_15790 [Mycena crocata]|nr:hypothetical protein C8R43DRAFT_15790 [Mycena crocata]
MPSSIFDDRDSTVTYTGSWIVGGSAHEYQNTVSSTTKAGDRFAFPFTGTSIGVYGTYDASSAGVRTSYAIDGGAATTVTSSASALDSYKQLFWQSDTLSPGQHKLVVTMQSVNPLPGGEGTIWFDYFNVTAAAVIPPSSPSSAASATASDITGGAIPSKTKGTSAGSSNTNTAAKSSNSAAADSKKSHSSAYIAGIVIALVVLVAVAAGLLWRRKRQRNLL